MRQIQVVPAVILLLAVTGCSLLPSQELTESLPDFSVETIDLDNLRRVEQVGQPVRYADLQWVEFVPAEHCAAVVEKYSREDTEDDAEDNVLKTWHNSGIREFVWYAYQGESERDAYYACEYDGRLLYSEDPGTEYHFYAYWMDESNIIFTRPDNPLAFFVYDTVGNTAYTRIAGKVMHLKMGPAGVLFNEVEGRWPQPPLTKQGFDRDSGMLLSLLRGEESAVLLYDLKTPGQPTVLLRGLPDQGDGYMVSPHWEEDGSAVWFTVRTNDPDGNGMAYRYNFATATLTPKLLYDFDAVFATFECMGEGLWLNHNQPLAGALADLDSGELSFLDEGQYAFCDRNSERLGALTFDQEAGIHYYWNLATKRRYYVNYSEILEQLPPGTELVYYHGVGSFHCDATGDTYSVVWPEEATARTPPPDEGDTAAGEVLLNADKGWLDLLDDALWHSRLELAVPFGDRYLFDSDGTYVFAEDQAKPEVARRYTFGNWWVEDDILYVSAQRIASYTGGDAAKTAVKDSGMLLSLLDSGEYEHTVRTEEERQVTELPLRRGDTDQGPSIWLGEYQMWPHKDTEPANGDMAAFRTYQAASVAAQP